MVGRVGGPDGPGDPAPDDAAVDRIEQQFTILFQRIRQRWGALATQVDPDLSPLGYRILTLLTNGVTTTATALTDRLGIDKSVLSRQLCHLEDLGLVERQVDKHDARTRLLSATPEAHTRMRTVRASSYAELHRTLSTWPAEDVRVLGELLGRLTGTP